MTRGKIPELVSDGLCINTECSIRGTNQCPVKRMLDGIAEPVKNNVINLPNLRGPMAGFQKKIYPRYLPSNTTEINEGKIWLEMARNIKEEDRLSLHDNVLTALKRPTKKTAEIIPFSRKEIA